MSTVLYIAPASGECHHPQARIYRAEFNGHFNMDGIPAHYRRHPERWQEVGLMNFEGKVVCFDGPGEQLQELIDCQPLMAGLTFTYTEEPA